MPASATEWMASASIELMPVRRNAMNLVIAMPVLASSAATTALVPPSRCHGASLGERRLRLVDTRGEPERCPRMRRTWCAESSDILFEALKHSD